jgi:hypothetical protein
MTDREMLEVALDEARPGLAEGGIPIGAALFTARGHAARPGPQRARARARSVPVRRDRRGCDRARTTVNG